MTEIFPLSGCPKYFIPTGTANFCEKIIDEIIDDIFFSYERETDSEKCIPTILNMNCFVQRLSPGEKIALVDEFVSRRFKKKSIAYFNEIYGGDQIHCDYFSLKPTCFLMLGGPSSQRYNAAKLFAKETNRVHLDVVDLVNLEMASGSKCGNWIYANMSAGKHIPISIILSLVRAAVKQHLVQERGYVLSGFPIIPEADFCSDVLPKLLTEIEEDFRKPPEDLVFDWTVNNPEAVHIRGFAGILPKFNTYAEEAELTVEAEKRDSLVLSLGTTKSSTESFQTEEESAVDLSTNLLRLFQQNTEWSSSYIESEYFESIANNPNLKLRVYEEDVISSVRKQLKFLMHLELTPDVIFFIRDRDPELSKLGRYGDSLYFKKTLIFELDSTSENRCFPSYTDLEAIHRGRYFKCLPEIGKMIQHYSKANVVKVDSRFSVHEMVKQFKTATAFTNYKVIHNAERIIPSSSLSAKMSTLPLDQYLDILCEHRCIQPNLKWMKPAMGTLCPVKLTEGKMTQGKAEYAARYLGRIFLLSSPRALDNFMANPKKYFFSKPNCRVAIVSIESMRFGAISNVFKHLFHAEQFSWRKSIGESAKEEARDIYAEAVSWASTVFSMQLESISAATVFTQENSTLSLDAVLEKSVEIQHISNITQNWNALSPSSNAVRLGTSLRDTALSSAEIQENTTLQVLNPSLTANRKAILDKLIEYKFNQLYKEKYPTKIADAAVKWIKLQSKTQNRPDNGERFYAQWILEDVPTHLDFWQKLAANHCLPDIVLLLQDDGYSDFKSYDMADFFLHSDSIEKISAKIRHCFPWPNSEADKIDLVEVVASTMTQEGSPLNFVLPFLFHKAEEDYFGESEMEIDEKTKVVDDLSNYLANSHIPLVVSQKKGQSGAFELLLNYLTLFRQKPKGLNGEDIEKLREICEKSYDLNPKLPNKCFTDYQSVYKLDVGYMRKGVKFEYDKQMRNYNFIHFNQEKIDEESDEEVVVEEEVDPTLDIDFLSERNIKSMEEKGSLSQISYGNTGKYCPVELEENQRLRLGSIEYTVEYGNKLYSMSSSQTYEQFMRCPLRYVCDQEPPPIPPFRICVIGLAGRNRNSFAKFLANKLSVKHIRFTKLMAHFLQRQYPENSAILDTEEEVYDHYGVQLLRSDLRKYFDEGVILEGFPNNKKQMEDMVRNKLIPELIYIVDGNPQEILYYGFIERQLRWQKQLEFKCQQYLKKVGELQKKSSEKPERRRMSEYLMRQSIDIKAQLNTLNKRIRLTQEEILGEEEFPPDVQGIENVQSIQLSAKEQISKKSSLPTKMDAELEIFSNEPDESNWEADSGEGELEEQEEINDIPENPLPSKVERLKITQNIMKTTKRAMTPELVELKEVIKMCIDNSIPVLNIPSCCSTRRYEERHSMCSSQLRKFIFDQVIMVSPEVAEKCLQTGYCLYSHFKNFCPVDAYNLMPINLHFSMKDCRKLYGCIYRNLLYYINGKENVVKFHATPRLYASGSNRFAFVGPIRILVIGAACSGATTLCRRIAREFSMAHLNSDSYFPEQRESGFKRRTLSQEFQRARVSQQSSIDLVTLVECLHLHRNDCPNGMVLDNFPITPKDLIDAAQENIGFHIVLIIKTDFSTVWRNWKTAYQQTEPQTMVNLIYELSILHKKFQRYAKILKRYETPQRDLDLFNIVYLKRTVSKWAQWEDAKSEILLCLREIGSYKKKLLNQECVGISRFNIFRKEYERRLSPTKMYCPICLKADGKLVMYRHDYHSVDAKFYSPACQRIINEPFGYNIYYLRNKHGFPKPYKVNISYPPIFSKNMFKTNLVQYLNHFYWTCDQHHLDVLLNSENHLPPSTLSYPPYLPFLVTNYFQKNIANEGFCVVTYHENLPKEIYIPGNPNYAVYYRGNVYLSASADCALQFLENPSLYYRVKMPPYTEPYLNVELKDMQIDFGPLTPQIIIEALTALAEHRPKHLALSIADSAAVFIGLYLKTINPISKSESLKLSEELYSKYIGECSYLKWLIDQFQQKINPYVAQ